MKPPNEELIVVEQLPIIREQLRIIGAEIDRHIDEALSLVCTEDSVRAIKAMRAQLNKDFANIEKRRAEVKTAIMTPYEQFNAVYKEYISDKYNAADATLKARIAEVEDDIKSRKRDELREWFDEYRLSKSVDIASMDTWRPNVTLTTTLTALKKEGKAYIDRICDDLALIETQEHKTEILVEYRRSLNVAQAITAVAERHRAIEEQARRQKEQEARQAAEAEAVKRVEKAVEALAPPVVKAEDDPIRTVAFRVTAPLSKLRELKKYLMEGGYEFE